MILGRQAAIAIENAKLYDRLRKMTEGYRHLHEFNDRILKSVSLGIYTVDNDLVITSWNNRMVEMSGVMAEQAIGARLDELFPNLAKEGFSNESTRLCKAAPRPSCACCIVNWMAQTVFRRDGLLHSGSAKM